MTDPHKPDSLAALGKAVTGSTRLQKAAPWIAGVLFGAFTGVAGWLGAKTDTRLEMQATLDLRADLKHWNDERVRDHKQLLAAIESLERRTLGEDVRDPGKITQVEKGVWLAFRALAEHHAMALAGESARARAAKEFQGGRFARSFDSRASGKPPQLAYAELIDQVAVP